MALCPACNQPLRIDQSAGLGPTCRECGAQLRERHEGEPRPAELERMREWHPEPFELEELRILNREK